MVGKYELLEFLGGGMSHVYRARDTVIDRPVVVKLLTLDASANAASKARFFQEARLAGNIQHENIVSIFDFGEHDGRPFIVMEYLKGEDLRDAIRAGRTGSLMERIKIALQIAAALEYVASKGIVHRDIKPENVHVDAQGRVKIMDFGIAKTEDLSLTKTGMAMGTPYYMAPEQVAGRPVTALADIYSFGMLLYELLTGQRAVNGDVIEAVMFQVLNVPLDPEPMVQAGVPPQLRTLVLRCAAKNPEERPQSFREVIEELRALVSGSTAEQTQAIPTKVLPTKTLQMPAPRPAPRKSIAPRLALVALLIVVVCGAAWWMTRKKAPLAITPRVIPGMIYFPAGSFLSGPKNTPTSLDAFYIDETEVSNADFTAYCHATKCVPPDAAPDLPVVHITATQARAFASWKGKRLPTALEWERAARGTNGAKFPWGDTEDASLANLDGEALKPVKSYEAYPVYQMAGNAWEMVEGKIMPSDNAVAQFAALLTPPPTKSEKWIAMRGGSFHTNLAAAVAYEFAAIPERYASSDIGFRCAK